MHAGLNSVDALRFGHSLQDKLPETAPRLPRTLVFDYPSAAAIAEYLSPNSGTDQQVTDHRSRTDVEQTLRLEPQASSMESQQLLAPQEQFWLLYELDSSAQYNIPFLLKMDGNIDSCAMLGSVGLLMSKHKVLTVRICHAHGRTTQAAQLPDLTCHESYVVDMHKGNLRVHNADKSALDLVHEGVLRVQLLHSKGQQHWLSLVIHHIAVDGMSMNPLLSDLTYSYNMLAASQDCEIKPLCVQYTDWGAWQQEMLQQGGCVNCKDGSLMFKELAYWREVLKDGELPLLLLNSDSSSVEQTLSSAFHQVPVCINAIDAIAIRALETKCRATTMQVVLALWAVLLMKQASQEAVVVGFATANRNHHLIYDVIGCFINTIAVPVTAGANDSFAIVVEAAAAAVQGALAHSWAPFHKVVAALKNRDTSSGRMHIYQTMCMWEGDLAPQGHPQLIGLDAHPIEDRLIASAEVELDLHDSPESDFVGTIKYNPDLHRHQYMEQLAHRLAVLAHVVSTQPESPLASFSTSSQCESELTLQRWNATSAPYAANNTAYGMFEGIAMQRGTGVALVFENEALSYGELELWTSLLASALVSASTFTDSVVGSCSEKSVEEVAGMVGIMRAGAGYLPLDPQFPGERLQYLVEQCKCVAIVVQQRHVEVLDGVDVEIVVAERGNAHRKQVFDANPCRESHLAYVLFTSGSTGKPKGLMIEHTSLVTFVNHKSGPYSRLSEEQAWCRLYVLAFTFSDSIGTVWRTLVSGGLLLVAKPGAWLNPEYLVWLICTHHVNSLWGVPSPFRLIMDATQDVIHASLIDLHLSGEAFPLHLGERILTNNKHVRLFNPYGMSEVTINSYAHTVTEYDIEAGSIPIGVALSNTSGWVFDSHCIARPLLAPGELHLGGPKVSRGYLGRNDLACQVCLPIQTRRTAAYTVQVCACTLL